ncbi:MAG: hypothetical protein P8129_03160 [Anaerolineae bacterium]
MKRNPEMVGVWAGLAVLVLGVACILLPLWTDMDLMQGGFALQFLGVFLAIVGVVILALYGYRARRLAAMVRGQKLLAHWRYDPVQAEGQAQRELAETRQRNWALLLIVAGFVVACTVLFTLYGILQGEGDDMPLFVAIMGGVLLVVAAFALLMPSLQYRRARQAGHEALVAEDGLYASGVLHTWNAPLSRLDAVTLEDDGGQTRLVFHLRSLSRTSATAYQAYTAEVPVPPGEEATARRIEAHFRDRVDVG